MLCIPVTSNPHLGIPPTRMMMYMLLKFKELNLLFTLMAQYYYDL